jgi:hypothetical protein
LLADRDDKDIYYTKDIYCPKCKSKIKSINSNYRVGLKEYKNLTFSNFERLNSTEKKNIIHELLKIYIR